MRTDGQSEVKPRRRWKAVGWALAWVVCWTGVVYPEELSRPLPGYEPKISADTILDYRRSLESRVSKLPPPSMDSMGELIRTLRTLQAEAAKNPGRWRDGNLPLGAEPNEYVPSDEELLISEVGERIRGVVEETPQRQLVSRLNRIGVSERFIEYNAVVIYHADVMGSGRFFYARQPKPVRVRLRQ